MSGAAHKVLTRALFAAWGMATLVLLSCVVLLVRELARSGASAAPGAVREPARSDAPAAGLPAHIASGEVTLYFADAGGQHLAPEVRRIETAGRTAENCRRALEELIRGPREGLTPILPDTTRIRGLFLLDNGELVVDLSREVELGLPKSASAEALMAYGIVNTLTQSGLKGRDRRDLPAVRVRFLFEGSPPGETFPGHMDLAEPVGPDRGWLGAGSGGAWDVR